MELFPEKLRILWTVWEIRVLVLVSLCLQIFLIIFGSRRKCSARSLMWISVWSAYLMADWVATVALGNLASNQGDSGDNSPKPNNVLQALWAPFLVLHLGGPDTITAYSLEDNELWLRHLLGLVVQVVVAFYVILTSWSNISLTFIAIPVFISGIIKYGERTFALWSSSTQRLKDVVFGLDFIREARTDQNLELAHFLFRKIKFLLKGGLSFHFFAVQWENFKESLPEDVFTVLEIELGFIYDVLYTKTTIVYSRWGIFLRCVSFLNSFLALVVFSIMVDIHDYSLIDISITYLLLVSAVVLEVYSSILHFLSDWTQLCLIHFKKVKPRIYNALCCLPDSPFFNNKRWSGSMGQFNLLSYCLKDMPVAKCIGVDKYMFVTREDVNAELKACILNLFREKYSLSRQSNFETRREILSRRGDYVLEKFQFGQDFRQFTVDIAFDRSLLIWHLATEFCYSLDDFNKGGDVNNIYPKCKAAKSLSDYMLYLLLLRPSMMPRRLDELNPVINPQSVFTETFSKIVEFMDSKQSVISNKKSEVYKACVDEIVGNAPGNINDPFAKGRRLAKRLHSFESQRKWEMISEVWVEMLGYAATHCEWKEHCQQLSKGGELLTHVYLLMVHLGLNMRYR